MPNAPDVCFQRATRDDAPILATLGATTFTEAFGDLYPQDDLEVFLAEAHSEAAWRHLLDDPQHAVWFAALPAANPIGFIVVGPCKVPVANKASSAGEVRRLYVLKRYHNLRVGAALMELGLDWLGDRGRNPIYIGVWSQNLAAQRFYARFGFEKVGEYGFPVGKTIDREFILRCSDVQKAGARAGTPAAPRRD